MIYFWSLVGGIVLIAVLINLYYFWEYISIRNLKARHFDSKMDVFYLGKVKDIRLNLDMWCTYKFFLEKEFNLKEDDNVEIYFTIKDGLNRYKVCKKFWSLTDKNKEKMYKFLKENFNYSCKIL